jgi:thiamine biosynthesis lipoprotein
MARKAILAFFHRMEELENILSRFKPDSQVSILNREGRISSPNPALINVIRQSNELSQKTDGAFDVTVNPLVDLYQAKPDSLPTGEQLNRTLCLVDYKKFSVNDHEIFFTKPDMSITLDGIAKGYIVDECVAVLKQYGVENVLTEAGGDLIALGGKPASKPWTIGLQNPRAQMGNMMATFPIHNQAVATSGDYMQAYTTDYLNHHIIDPRLGHSPRELASASVFAPSLALADGLATAMMVMGKSGLWIIENIPDCDAVLVTKDLHLIKTSGLET